MTQIQYRNASRLDLADTIVRAKAKKSLTYAQIANGTGLSEAFVTAALLGQHPLPANVAEIVGKKLDLARTRSPCSRPFQSAEVSKAASRPIRPSIGSTK